MSDFQTWIDNNAGFAAGFDQGELPIPPRLSALIVTCLDSRVNPSDILGLALGDAFVIRGLGGRVTDEVLEQVAIMQSLVAGMGGGPLDVIVVHHTDCGIRMFGDPELRNRLIASVGASDAKLLALAATDPRESVAEDLARLAAATNLPEAMRVAGYVYDVKTGRLEEVSAD